MAKKSLERCKMIKVPAQQIKDDKSLSFAAAGGQRMKGDNQAVTPAAAGPLGIKEGNYQGHGVERTVYAAQEFKQILSKALQPAAQVASTAVVQNVVDVAKQQIEAIDRLAAEASGEGPQTVVTSSGTDRTTPDARVTSMTETRTTFSPRAPVSGSASTSAPSVAIIPASQSQIITTTSGGTTAAAAGSNGAAADTILRPSLALQALEKKQKKSEPDYTSFAPPGSDDAKEIAILLAKEGAALEAKK